MKNLESSIAKFETSLNSSQKISAENMKDIKGGGPFYDAGYWLGTKTRELIDWWNS